MEAVIANLLNGMHDIDIDGEGLNNEAAIDGYALLAPPASKLAIRFVILLCL
jgi:hypothetical protein